jgi:hypothetical protein
MKPILALLVLVAACSKDNPYYCENNPEHNCALDAATTDPDGPTACTDDEMCSGTTPACNLTTSMCVQCTATNATECEGMTPVCGSNACRGCTMNAECMSGACMPDGSCAPPEAVLHASSSGSGTTCAVGDVCSLEQAITVADTTKNVIVLAAGSYTTSGTVSTGKTLTLLGRDAIINKGASGNPVFGLTSGANVSIFYATIQSGDDNSLGHGIACSGATLVTRFVNIQNNDANGINATACNVTVDRSRFTGNTSGAILLAGTNEPFSLTNNEIYLNGSSTLALFGGIKLSVTGNVGSSRIEFNTIIDNTAKTGTGNSGGIACGSTAATVANTIIARNVLGTSTSATDAQSYGDCTFPSSLRQADVTGLEFVNATSFPYSLKIGSTSTAKDAALTASTVDVDFEGDKRPQFGVSDIGADEYK